MSQVGEPAAGRDACTVWVLDYPAVRQLQHLHPYWFAGIRDYLVYLRASGATSGTLRVHAHYAARLATAHPDGPASLTAETLTLFVANPTWSSETRRSARSALRTLTRWAYTTGRADHDFGAALPAVAIRNGVPKPTPDAVFAAALARADDRSRLMLHLAAYAGLRRAEIAQVHTRDIEGDSLRVHGKGERTRLVPLHRVLAAELATRTPGFVFPGQIDGHLSADRVGVILSRLLGDGFSGHTLRHRFATRAYAHSSDLFAVQQLLGHSKPETTLRYTVLPDGALRAAVDAVG